MFLFVHEIMWAWVRPLVVEALRVAVYASHLASLAEHVRVLGVDRCVTLNS